MRKKVLAAMIAAGILTGICSCAAYAEVVTENTTEAAGNADESKIADAGDMTQVEDVIEDWMVPIPADELVNGVYDIEVRSSSSMFNITSGLLIVSDDDMEAVMTMGGTGYLYVYPGTPEEAAAADESDYIPYVEDDNGAHTFLLPVEALDAPVKCAAFSKNKEKWYDRTLVFVSTDLPDDAFLNARYVTVEELGLADGEYTVEVTLNGGSGKASVASPAALTIENGAATLTTEFSSANYDYVLIGDEKFRTVNEDGNSTFLLPVSGFDYNMPIIADTTAMSKPHEIDYTLYLDSSTIAPAK